MAADLLKVIGMDGNTGGESFEIANPQTRWVLSKCTLMNITPVEAWMHLLIAELTSRRPSSSIMTSLTASLFASWRSSAKQPRASAVAAFAPAGSYAGAEPHAGASSCKHRG
jgi:hypothetical protein